MNFLQHFSTDIKSAWTSAFFDTIFDLFEKNFLGLISTFFKLWSQTRKIRHQKSKNVLSKCVSHFWFCTHQRVCVLNFLKKSQIRCTYCSGHTFRVPCSYSGTAMILCTANKTTTTHKFLLKVPKREKFSHSFFALSEPIWVCDLGAGKNWFFIIWPLILMVSGF